MPSSEPLPDLMRIDLSTSLSLLMRGRLYMPQTFLSCHYMAIFNLFLGTDVPTCVLPPFSADTLSVQTAVCISAALVCRENENQY